MWLSQFIEILKDLGAIASPIIIIDEYDRGVQLRAGKFYKINGPGIHYKWPIYEKILITSIALNTTRTTITIPIKNQIEVTITTTIKYNISNPKTYLLKIDDRDDFLLDYIAVAVKECVRGLTYEELISKDRDLENQTLLVLQREIKRHGFKVTLLRFTTMCRTFNHRNVSTSEE